MELEKNQSSWESINFHGNSRWSHVTACFLRHVVFKFSSKAKASAWKPQFYVIYATINFYWWSFFSFFAGERTNKLRVLAAATLSTCFALPSLRPPVKFCLHNLAANERERENKQSKSLSKECLLIAMHCTILCLCRCTVDSAHWEIITCESRGWTWACLSWKLSSLKLHHWRGKKRKENENLSRLFSLPRSMPLTSWPWQTSSFSQWQKRQTSLASNARWDQKLQLSHKICHR